MRLLRERVQQMRWRWRRGRRQHRAPRVVEEGAQRLDRLLRRLDARMTVMSAGGQGHIPAVTAVAKRVLQKRELERVMCVVSQS